MRRKRKHFIFTDRGSGNEFDDMLNAIGIEPTSTVLKEIPIEQPIVEPPPVPVEAEPPPAEKEPPATEPPISVQPPPPLVEAEPPPLAVKEGAPSMIPTVNVVLPESVVTPLGNESVTSFGEKDDVDDGWGGAKSTASGGGGGASGGAKAKAKVQAKAKGTTKATGKFLGIIPNKTAKIIGYSVVAMAGVGLLLRVAKSFRTT